MCGYLNRIGIGTRWSQHSLWTLRTCFTCWPSLTTETLRTLCALWPSHKVSYTITIIINGEVDLILRVVA